jgi:hypothetical protein
LTFIAALQICIDLVGALAACTGAVAAMLAALHGWRNAQAIQSIHVDINSRMTQLLEVTGHAKYAEGVTDAKAAVAQQH